jgi:hypothetical protein
VAPEVDSKKRLAQLHKKIKDHFGEEDLRTLCFDMGVEYESLPAQGKEGKARELVALLDRQGRIPELTQMCSDACPNVDWENISLGPRASVPAHRSRGQARKIFISYKRNDPSQRLARYLQKFLTRQGHTVFIDATLRTGEAWLEEIGQHIENSDFLLVLLSQESIYSEMMRAELNHAYEHQKRQGHPRILPVRVAFEDVLPLSIGFFLNPLQYVSWWSETDNERVCDEVLAALEGRLPDRLPVSVKPRPAGLVLDDDVGLVAASAPLFPPRPKVEVGFLQELDSPTDVVELPSRFYIRRKTDDALELQLTKSSGITTVRAPRQTGKSSLLVRTLQYARKQGRRVVNLDMQDVHKHLASEDVFLRCMAEEIACQLGLDVGQIEKLWAPSPARVFNLTGFMEKYVLPASDVPLVLAMDEVDRLLSADFHSDFFSTIRSWHTKQALGGPWSKLNIVMAISTDPFLLISDIRQSPFNVGLVLELEDFDETQVRDLNVRHLSPMQEPDIPRLMQLLNGHPYLTRKALYTLVTKGLTWSELERVATTDQGPFSDHLRYYHWILVRDKQLKLKEALAQLIHHNSCTDENAFLRLTEAGLVNGSCKACRCRCDLYRLYFEDKL